MMKDKRVAAVVFAPKVDGGLARKNLRQIKEYSLVELAYQSACNSGLVDRVVIASDDPDTITFCMNKGMEISPGLVFKHPEKMVGFDKCGLGAAQKLSDFDYIVVLDVTTPLRLTVDIDNVLALCESEGGKPVVTVSDTTLTVKDLHYVDGSRGLTPAASTIDNAGEQERRLYQINYSVLASSKIYLRSAGSFFGSETKAYLIPNERSLAIQSKSDLAFAETLIEKQFFYPPEFKTQPL